VARASQRARSLLRQGVPRRRAGRHATRRGARRGCRAPSSITNKGQCGARLLTAGTQQDARVPSVASIRRRHVCRLGVWGASASAKSRCRNGAFPRAVGSRLPQAPHGILLPSNRGARFGEPSESAHPYGRLSRAQAWNLPARNKFAPNSLFWQRKANGPVQQVQASLLPDVSWAVRVPRAPPRSCPSHGMRTRHVTCTEAATGASRRPQVAGATTASSAMYARAVRPAVAPTFPTGS
jgi:hypothetical protein